jgi:histidinol phosphatase-like enzyme (inositol monophosphatase family)
VTNRLPWRDLIDTAQTLADLADKTVLRHFRRPIPVDDKARPGGAFDPVTVADRGAERIIRRHLARAHPDHGILGEEFGLRAGSSGLTWVIDPIDGTKAFITGTPMWGTLIGLLDRERAVLGLMSQSFTRERVWSSEKSSNWRAPDGRIRRLKTRPTRALADAMLMTTSPDLLGGDAEREAFHRVKARVRLTRYGGDCYAYCLLAAGHIDLVIEAGLKPHDIVALIPIIERAGGRVTTWEGGRPEGGGRIVAAGDQRLHEAALRVLTG